MHENKKRPMQKIEKMVTTSHDYNRLALIAIEIVVEPAHAPLTGQWSWALRMEYGSWVFTPAKGLESTEAHAFAAGMLAREEIWELLRR